MLHSMSIHCTVQFPSSCEPQITDPLRLLECRGVLSSEVLNREVLYYIVTGPLPIVHVTCTYYFRISEE